MTKPGPTFVLHLRAGLGGIDSIHALRALLKILLRRFNLRCISIREVQDDGDAK
jgi:hypothetical protein